MNDYEYIYKNLIFNVELFNLFMKNFMLEYKLIINFIVEDNYFYHNISNTNQMFMQERVNLNSVVKTIRLIKSENI